MASSNVLITSDFDIMQSGSSSVARPGWIWSCGAGCGR